MRASNPLSTCSHRQGRSPAVQVSSTALLRAIKPWWSAAEARVAPPMRSTRPAWGSGVTDRGRERRAGGRGHGPAAKAWASRLPGIWRATASASDDTWVRPASGSTYSASQCATQRAAREAAGVSVRASSLAALAPARRTRQRPPLGRDSPGHGHQEAEAVRPTPARRGARQRAADGRAPPGPCRCDRCAERSSSAALSPTGTRWQPADGGPGWSKFTSFQRSPPGTHGVAGEGLGDSCQAMFPDHQEPVKTGRAVIMGR
jgi:hypothetical protein